MSTHDSLLPSLDVLSKTPFNSLSMCAHCIPGTYESVQDKSSKLTKRESFEFECLVTLFSHLLSMQAECGDDVGLTCAYPAIPALSLVSPPFVPQWYYTVLVARMDYHPISRSRSPFIL